MRSRSARWLGLLGGLLAISVVALAVTGCGDSSDSSTTLPSSGILGSRQSTGDGATADARVRSDMSADSDPPRRSDLPPRSDATPASAIGTSRYSSQYRAHVLGVTRHSHTFTVAFDAQGLDDLRLPGTSCVRSSGGGESSPLAVRLTTRRSDRYRGRMTFPYPGMAGTSSFVYSCEDDYSAVPLFEVLPEDPGTARLAPDGSLGISRYSESYYAELGPLVQGPRTFEIAFRARGADDLRDPRTSCVRVGERTLAPLLVRLDEDRPGRYSGSFLFAYSGRGEYRFNYSCEDDYSDVQLFTRH